MQSRISNIPFILSISHDADDLSAVVIKKTYETLARAVSNDHLLSIAIAVDEEIARIEYEKGDAKNLVELYRIRYECVDRIMNYLIENHEIANNDYGMALRAYVFTHIDGNENEIARLKQNKIYPISLPDAAANFAKEIPNKFYQNILWYALSYFQKDSNNHVSGSGFTAKSVRHHRHDKRTVIDFSIIGEDPVAGNESDARYVPIIRDVYKLHELCDLFFKREDLDVNRFDLVDEQNKKLIISISELFSNPGMCISKDDIETKKELGRLIKDKNEENGLFGKMQPGVAVLKYHHDMNAYEKTMNDLMEKGHAGLEEWKGEWRRLRKYAHTSPEYLPHFMNALVMIDTFLDAIQQAVVMNKEVSMADKARYMIAISQFKDAVAREREQICESMLARLEIIGADVLLAIENGNNTDEIFYANIVHDQYQKALDGAGARPALIPKKFMRRELTREHIAQFKEFIVNNGTPLQQLQLVQLTPEMQARLLETSVALDESYVNPSSAPVDFYVGLPEGELNIQDIALENYVSREQLENNTELMGKLRDKIAEFDRVDPRIIDEVTENQIRIFHIMESVSKDQGPYTGIAAFLHDAREGDGFSENDAIFFARLFIDKFFPDLKHKAFFANLIVVSLSKFEVADTFDEFSTLYNHCENDRVLDDFFTRISAEEFRAEHGDIFMNFMHYHRWLRDEVGVSDGYMANLVDQVRGMDDLEKVNVKLSNAYNDYDSGVKIFDNVKGDFVVPPRADEVMPVMVEVEESALPEASRQQTRPWWKTALIGAGIGLFAVGVAVAGLALGIPALLATVTGAIVVGAVAGAAMLIGFGIGAIVGKVREKRLKNKPESRRLLNSDEAGNDIDRDYSPRTPRERNDGYERLPQEEPPRTSGDVSGRKSSASGVGVSGVGLWSSSAEGDKNDQRQQPKQNEKDKSAHPTIFKNN